MEKVTVLVQLTRPAKKSGGDRYEGMTHKGEDFVVYFPQSISRQENQEPAKSLQVEIEEIE